MLDRDQRHVDAKRRGDRAGPLTATQHDSLALDATLIRDDSLDDAIHDLDVQHPRVFADCCPCHSRAARQR